MLFWIYNIVVTTTFFFIGPFVVLFFFIRGHADGLSLERLGWLSPRVVPSKGRHRRIWIHAVSVGEVKVAKVIARALNKKRKDLSLVLSTTTSSGRQTALREMPEGTIIIYNPLDLWWCVRSSLRRVSPDLFVNLETEIWPNLLWACKKLEIPAFLVNGRISARSIDTYKRLRFLMKDVLSSFVSLSMISEDDAGRIVAMGAEPQKVTVGGNAKYDLLIEEARPALSRRITQEYGIAAERPVFIAGSTRGGEEEIILEAYVNLLSRYPEMLLIIVPRHIERCGDIESIIRSHSLNYCLRSCVESDMKRDRETNVILVDVHGELFGLYSLGTIIFCGASLVPLGGQNILEAAVWGKPVLYGPSMEDFLDATALLEGVGAGFTVENSDALVRTAVWLLENPVESDRLGALARQEIARNSGAGKKQLEHIVRFLDERR